MAEALRPGDGVAWALKSCQSVHQSSSAGKSVRTYVLVAMEQFT